MNYAEGVDALYGIVQTFATAQGITVQYPDIPFTKPNDAAWVSAMVRHATGKQASLSNQNGVRIWDNEGTMAITLYAPIGNGMHTVYALATSAVSALRAVKGSLWIRNIRTREMTAEGGFSRIQVLCDFQYTDTE